MELLTKEIKEQLQKQYAMGSDMEQMVVAKLFDPCGSFSWYLLNQDPNDTTYLWGIVKGFEVEMGSIYLPELEEFKGRLGIGIERDLSFNPMPAKELWKALLNGKHV